MWKFDMYIFVIPTTSCCCSKSIYKLLMRKTIIFQDVFVCSLILSQMLSGCCRQYPHKGCTRTGDLLKPKYGKFGKWQNIIVFCNCCNVHSLHFSLCTMNIIQDYIYIPNVKVYEQPQRVELHQRVYLDKDSTYK